MPSGCCVLMCSNQIGGHTFPVERERKLKWLQQIKRLTKDSSTGKLTPWAPTKHSVVCYDHFTQEDYIGMTGELIDSLHTRNPFSFKLNKLNDKA